MKLNSNWLVDDAKSTNQLSINKGWRRKSRRREQLFKSSETSEEEEESSECSEDTWSDDNDLQAWTGSPRMCSRNILRSCDHDLFALEQVLRTVRSVSALRSLEDGLEHEWLMRKISIISDQMH